ncbi:MAG: DHH family phosphoesterase [Bacteroidales bacterium]|nr:DHH family phosphoesterase [Bacteroidales bacterium]
MREHPYISDADTVRFEDLLRQASTVGIVTHTRPDGDAVGSCLALKHFIRERIDAGKECRILLDTEAPEAVRFLFSPADGDQTLVHRPDPAAAESFVAACDLLICLDFNHFSRAGGLEAVLQASKARKILVDHHPGPDLSRFDLAFSETEVSSTCELLFRILSRCPSGREEGLPKACLDPLLTGITTDTNNFANSVFGATLETVSTLLDAGADRETILEHLYNEYPERRIRLLGHLLDRELVLTGRGVAYMILDAGTADSYGILEGETEGFVNIPLAIDRVKMSLFLRQDGDQYRVSIRSKKGWSAQRLAARFFEGGGHEQASGGKVRLGGDLREKADVAAWIERCTEIFFHDENR